MLSKSEKREILRYFVLSKRCVCGKLKKKERWVCLDCRKELINTPKAKSLDKACQKHLSIVKEMLKDCKKE